MKNTLELTADYNSKIKIRITPGHYATNHSHVNYFVDLTDVRTQYRMAREAGRALSAKFTYNAHVDTVLCLEGTDLVGAFLAQDLGHHGHGLNAGKDIAVIAPETNTNYQLIFRDNLLDKIRDKSILLLISSVSTGKSITRSVECLQYYGGHLEGVAALFSAIPEFGGTPIVSIFNTRDCPDYASVRLHDCPLCKANQPVEAIVNCFGYSKI